MNKFDSMACQGFGAERRRWMPKIGFKPGPDAEACQAFGATELLVFPVGLMTQSC
jgi:hypothetical protein